jgi:lipopolysaccharide export LptBFGC system permease protein LptF
MIFRRYLLRELFGTWLLWSMALALILLSIVATKTFNQIDIQALDWMTWSRLFLINGLRYFPHLLAIATYLAVFNTSTRYWSEGEIWVWRNAGLTSRVLLQQLSFYILPMTVMMFFLSCCVVPWSYQQGALQQLAIARAPLTRFSQAGQFLRFPAGLTVRVEGKTSGKSLSVASRAPTPASAGSSNEQAQSVFVFRESGKGNALQHASIWAKGAVLDPVENKVVLTLKEGVLRQYRALDTAPKLVMRFNALRYFFSLPNSGLDDNPKWMAWSRLWRFDSTSLSVHRSAQAERYWRLSFPTHVFLMSMMAWCLGRHHSRSGQSAHLLSLILIDQLYLNLVNVFQDMIEKGNASWPSLELGWLLHGGFIAVAWVMWVRQSR